MMQAIYTIWKKTAPSWKFKHGHFVDALRVVGWEIYDCREVNASPIGCPPPPIAICTTKKGAQNIIDLLQKPEPE